MRVLKSDNLTILQRYYRSGMISKKKFIEQCSRIHQSLFDLASSIKISPISQISIAKDGVCYQLAKPKVRFFFKLVDKRAAPVEALNFGSYEKNLLDVLMWAIRKNSSSKGVIIDAGANVGWYSIIIGSLFPKQEIVAFEPIAPIYRNLVSNITLNNLSNVLAINQGLSDKCKKVKFGFDINCSVSANFSNTHGLSKERIGKLTTLDDYIRKYNKKIKLIKADIEGAELLLLKGAAVVLERDKPIVFCEILRKWSARFDYHPNDLVHYCSDYGYVCFAISDRKGSKTRKVKSINESTVETNFLFLHKTNHRKLVESLCYKNQLKPR